VLKNLRLHRVSDRLADHLLLGAYYDHSRPRRVDWAEGAFVLLRREAFDEVGGFDTRQFMYAEEVDLAWRLAKRGWSVHYDPTAIAKHATRAASTKAFGTRYKALYASAAETYSWMARRRGLAYTRAYALVNLCGASARFALLTPFLPLLSPRLRKAWRDDAARMRLHLIGLRRRGEMLRLPELIAELRKRYG
jgi:GT2 family glycosyltransferase